MLKLTIFEHCYSKMLLNTSSLHFTTLCGGILICKLV